MAKAAVMIADRFERPGGYWRHGDVSYLAGRDVRVDLQRSNQKAVGGVGAAKFNCHRLPFYERDVIGREVEFARGDGHDRSIRCSRRECGFRARG